MQVVVVDMTMLWIAIFKWFERVPLWVAGLAASLGLGLGLEVLATPLVVKTCAEFAQEV